jgi:putative ABC transport system permease protein
MRAMLTEIGGNLRRHRLQTIVVFIIVALAAGVGTLSLEILGASSAPYDRAFAKNRGAHVDVQFDGSTVTTGQLSATAQLPDVTTTAGPWALKIIPFSYGAAKSPLFVIGRSDPGGPLDHLQIVAGRWVQQPGEIVLTRSFAQAGRLSIGSKITALSRPDKPQMTVVGLVVDIQEADVSLMNPQFSWVVPAQLPSLLASGDHTDYQMLYRFRHAKTDADLQQDIHQIAHTLPAGAISSTLTYLMIKSLVNVTSDLVLAFLLAFSAFALGAAALIIANVVAGAVIASYRDIGVIKALGFTPGQVLLSFVGQMLIPALIGCIVGATLGEVGSAPLLASSEEALGLSGASTVTVVPAIMATLGALAVVVVAATIPALRGGMLRPVIALSRNAAPNSQRHNRLGQLMQWLHLPRIFSLGAGDAFARPIRGLLTVLAIVIGVATLTFAFGLHNSLIRLATEPGLNPDETITRFGAYPDTQVMQALRADPDTENIVAFTFARVTVPGLSNPVSAIPMRGDSAKLGYQILQGRWFSGPGEAVGGSAFVHEAHLKVGDTFTASVNNHTVPLRLVGVYFDTDNFGRVLRFDWASFLAVNPTEQPTTYLVTLHPSADLKAYARRITATSPDFLSSVPRTSMLSPILSTLDSVLLVLVIVLVIIALVGVFNTVLLSTRERIRDTATLKSLGMTPTQVVGMVVASAVVIGVIGGALGLPLGVWLHQALLTLMGSIVNDPISPGLARGGYTAVNLPLLALAGVLVAVAGAALPAWIAARQPVVEVLRAE